MQVSTRNLRENQLGGVIFGCKHETIKECFDKQLFGLPSLHFSYVRNVKAGLPLFLFNYSDRKMYGVFEAASSGQNCIDPYAWSNDGTLKTPFPAQVCICEKTLYPPLLEDQYKQVLHDNYYTRNFFYFELDHAQTRALIALFKSLGLANISQVPAVPRKMSQVLPSLSTNRITPVTHNKKKDTSNLKNTNPFGVLSTSENAADDWADSDVDSGNASRTSHINTDEKLPVHVVSHWEDRDDYDLNISHRCSIPDEASPNSSYKTVTEGMDRTRCNQLAVNPINGGSPNSDKNILVNSQDEHSCDVVDDGIDGQLQSGADCVQIKPERPSVLKKLKKLFALRQQAEVARSSQEFVHSIPGQYFSEEIQVVANFSSEGQHVPEETHVNANSSEGQHVPEETRVNASLSTPDERAHAIANFSSESQHVPEETHVNANSSEGQHVPEETQVNASLSTPDEPVPEEIQVNAGLSNPDHCVPEETQANGSLSENPSGGTMKDDTSFKQHGNAELRQIVTMLAKKANALEKNQINSDQAILSLGEVIKDSERKIHQLEYRIDGLQFKLDSSLSLGGSMCDNLDKPSIFLIGGYNGVNWLSSLDSFSPKSDTLVHLASMGSERSYASVAALGGCIFVFGGGNGKSYYNTVECYNTMANEWMVCPCLNREKGSLAGVSVDGKIYAIGGGTENASYSEVEMFDPYLAKWIHSPSMLHSRYALAAAESSGIIYVAGGYDGSKYLQSAERYDPREGLWVRLPTMNTGRGSHALAVMGEVLYAIGGYDGNSMLSSVEVFDPRLNAWRMADPMSNPRGYGSAVTLDDSLFVIGGLGSKHRVLDDVEVYSVSSGWSIPGFKSIGKRSLGSAIVM